MYTLRTTKRDVTRDWRERFKVYAQKEAGAVRGANKRAEPPSSGE